MNVFAINAVNAHIDDLMADARAERAIRAARPKRRGLVASIVAAARATLAPAAPRLATHPRH